MAKFQNLTTLTLKAVDGLNPDYLGEIIKKLKCLTAVTLLVNIWNY